MCNNLEVTFYTITTQFGMKDNSKRVPLRDMLMKTNTCASQKVPTKTFWLDCHFSLPTDLCTNISQVS